MKKLWFYVSHSNIADEMFHVAMTATQLDTEVHNAAKNALQCFASLWGPQQQPRPQHACGLRHADNVPCREAAQNYSKIFAMLDKQQVPLRRAFDCLRLCGRSDRSLARECSCFLA